MLTVGVQTYLYRLNSKDGEEFLKCKKVYPLRFKSIFQFTNKADILTSDLKYV